MTITTEEAERLATMLVPLTDVATSLRSLAAERDAIQARVAELAALLLESRDDITEWIDVAHPHREKYPHIMRDFENDMEIVRRIDAALEGWGDYTASLDAALTLVPEGRKS
jgi:hypothetical protein